MLLYFHTLIERAEDVSGFLPPALRVAPLSSWFPSHVVCVVLFLGLFVAPMGIVAFLTVVIVLGFYMVFMSFTVVLIVVALQGIALVCMARLGFLGIPERWPTQDASELV